MKIQAQDYLDILRISGNNSSLGNLKNDEKTTVNNLNIELNYPIKLNEKLVLLTGFSFENSNLSLLNMAERGNLLMTRLNLGIKYKYSAKWSGTFVLLPKIASDFKNIESRDFQISTIAIMDYQLSEMWKLKFGLYSSTENFGSILTPLLGVWHRSKNKKFYINATLPIRMDMNYSLTKYFSVGADLLTSIKSYNLSQNNSTFYVQEESMRFALYLSHGFFKNALIVRARGGFDSSDYGLYNSSEKTGFQIFNFPFSADSRDRLNPEFKGAVYVGADLIYRLDLTIPKK